MKLKDGNDIDIILIIIMIYHYCYYRHSTDYHCD